jgi:uncharacterized membrane protein
MMSDSTVFLLARVLHILAGTIWTGAAILIACFVMPAVQAAGPAGAAVMRQLTIVRKVPLVLTVVAILAVLSGIYLYWTGSGGLGWAWFHTATGASYTAGATAALVALIIGAGINIPAANRMGAIAETIKTAGGQPTAAQSETLKVLALRVILGTRAVAVLLAVATAAMSAARYLA